MADADRQPDTHRDTDTHALADADSPAHRHPGAHADSDRPADGNLRPGPHVVARGESTGSVPHVVDLGEPPVLVPDADGRPDADAHPHHPCEAAPEPHPDTDRFATAVFTTAGRGSVTDPDEAPRRLTPTRQSSHAIGRAPLSDADANPGWHHPPPEAP